MKKETVKKETVKKETVKKEPVKKAPVKKAAEKLQQPLRKSSGQGRDQRDSNRTVCRKILLIGGSGKNCEGRMEI